MVKFQKQFEKQLVPEWRAMYCDYKQLKKEVKKIKLQIAHTRQRQQRVCALNQQSAPVVTLSTLRRSTWNPENAMVVHTKKLDVDEDLYETVLLGQQEEHEHNFFASLDLQLNKVNKFQKSKEEEYSAQAEQLEIQMSELLAMQQALKADDTSAGDGYKGSISKAKVQRAAKMLQAAFVEFYRGLRFLRNFSSLNMMAFVKILKKYDKVTARNASVTYLRVVERSYFATSDKVLTFMDRAEAVFTQYFLKGNRKQAMAYLRPMQQSPAQENINFVLGLFTGCSWSLVIAFACILILGNNGAMTAKYMQSVFPVFSTLLLFVIHLYMYGWNMYFWKRVRINYMFIFEFPPGNELRYQDVLLLSTVLTTLIIIGMILHVATYTAVVHIHSEIIALAIFIVFLALLVCPVNICYRSSRAAFLRCLWKIVSSPLCKVAFADFFLADQLTSQVPALRNLGNICCYYGGGFFVSRNTAACTESSGLFQSFLYLISVLPYWWRLMQCWRRWMDEHHTPHIANGGKYLSALIAVVARLTYAHTHSDFWLGIFVIVSIVATIYQLYWDLVVDWGLLKPKSVNPWLRDQLILKRKTTYFISMAANVVLRLGWIYSVTHIPNIEVEHMLLDFLFAAMEVIRRGHWNFYRVENEHLNNVGNYRAVRAVPLPFRHMDGVDVV